MATVRTSWSLDDPATQRVRTARADLVDEVAVTAANDPVSVDAVTGAAPIVAAFDQRHGPFTEYRRTLCESDGQLHERIDYRLRVPWFGVLFVLPMRWTLRHRPANDDHQPWWSPRGRLDARQVLVLGLLGAASVVAGYLNTLFTQTSTFAAKDFGIDKHGLAVAGTVVRLGIVFALPLTLAADRIGRRKAMLIAAWTAPVIGTLGALAPNFAVLTATQAVSRPLGLALDILVAVVAAEEMSRDGRAYAVSVLAMAAGFGAGLCVMALPLADLGPGGWRYVYVVPIVFLVIALDLLRRLPETARFEHTIETNTRNVRPQRSRFVLLAVVALIANIFVAPASFFQNNYLETVRHFSASRISLFTLATQTPAGVGLLIGGRLADARGRRFLGAAALLGGTALAVVSFAVGGWGMWASAFVGGTIAGAGYPALFVYRTELFPTGSRSWVGGVLTATALVGGSAGLLGAGQLLDHHSYGSVMGGLALAEVVVAILVLTRYPETAHRELEELNPEDAGVPAGEQTASRPR